VGDRTTLNELHESIRVALLTRFPRLNGFKSSCRDFRSGDGRHSLADIGKAQSLLGYRSTHRVEEGLVEGMAWYVRHLSPPAAARTISFTSCPQRDLISRSHEA